MLLFQIRDINITNLSKIHFNDLLCDIIFDIFATVAIVYSSEGKRDVVFLVIKQVIFYNWVVFKIQSKKSLKQTIVHSSKYMGLNEIIYVMHQTFCNCA